MNRGRAAHMAATKPFRHLILYPALVRMIGRERDRIGMKKGEPG